MKKSITVIDKLVILCRNVEQTSSVYCEALGLKVTLQSPQLVQLKDANNLSDDLIKSTEMVEIRMPRKINEAPKQIKIE